MVGRQDCSSLEANQGSVNERIRIRSRAKRPIPLRSKSVVFDDLTDPWNERFRVLAVDGHYRRRHRQTTDRPAAKPLVCIEVAPGRIVVSTVGGRTFSFTTIEVRTAKMLRHLTVRAAKTRIIASGCRRLDGNRPVLDLSAVCRSTTAIAENRDSVRRMPRAAQR